MQLALGDAAQRLEQAAVRAPGHREGKGCVGCRAAGEVVLRDEARIVERFRGLARPGLDAPRRVGVRGLVRRTSARGLCEVEHVEQLRAVVRVANPRPPRAVDGVFDGNAEADELRKDRVRLRKRPPRPVRRARNDQRIDGGVVQCVVHGRAFSNGCAIGDVHAIGIRAERWSRHTLPRGTLEAKAMRGGPSQREHHGSDHATRPGLLDRS
mmetsp:Transcript_4251/g.13325  ORF Transcript_4251/g.13325 Transcript_4251/m.13325 type:complete len:211 (+) Transcript_4251:552-1184(+)